MKKILSIFLTLAMLLTSTSIVFADEGLDYTMYAEREFLELTFNDTLNSTDDYSITVKDVAADSSVQIESESIDGTNKVLTAEFANKLDVDKAYSVTVSDGTNTVLKYFRLESIVNDSFDYASTDEMKANWGIGNTSNSADIVLENGALKYASPASSINVQNSIYPINYDNIKNASDYVVEYKITHQGVEGCQPANGLYAMMSVRDTAAKTDGTKVNISGVALGYGDRFNGMIAKTALTASNGAWSIPEFNQYLPDGTAANAALTWPAAKNTFAYNGKVSVRGTSYKATLAAADENNTAAYNGRAYQYYDYTYTMPESMANGAFRIVCRGFAFLLDDVCAYSFKAVEAEDFSNFSIYADKDSLSLTFAQAIKNPSSVTATVKEYVNDNVVEENAALNFADNNLSAELDFSSRLKLDTVYNVSLTDGIVSSNKNFKLASILTDDFDYGSDEELQKNWTLKTDNTVGTMTAVDGRMHIYSDTTNKPQMAVLPAEFENQKTLTDYVVEYDAEFASATVNGSYLMPTVREIYDTNYRMSNNAGKVSGIGVSVADRMAADANMSKIDPAANADVLTVIKDGKQQTTATVYFQTNPYKYNAKITVKGSEYNANFNTVDSSVAGWSNLNVLYAIPEGTSAAGGFKFFARTVDAYIDNFAMYKCVDVEAEDLNNVKSYAERNEIDITLESEVKNLESINVTISKLGGGDVTGFTKTLSADKKTIILNLSESLELDKVYNMTIADSLKSVTKSFMLKKYIYDDFSTYASTADLQKNWVVGKAGTAEHDYGAKISDGKMYLESYEENSTAKFDNFYTIMYNPNVTNMTSVSDYVVEIKGERANNYTTNSMFGISVRETMAENVTSSQGGGGLGILTLLQNKSIGLNDHSTAKTINQDFVFKMNGEVSDDTRTYCEAVGNAFNVKASVQGSKYAFSGTFDGFDKRTRNVEMSYDIPEDSNQAGFLKLCVNDFAVKLSEVAVYQYSDEFDERVYAYEYTKPEVSENTVSGSYNLFNTYAQDKNYSMVVAAYAKDTNELLGCKVISGTAVSDELTSTENYTLTINSGTVGTVKLILLDGINTLVPYSKPISFIY